MLLAVACKSKKPAEQIKSTLLNKETGIPQSFFDATQDLALQNYTNALRNLYLCKEVLKDSSGWYATAARAYLGLNNLAQAHAELDTALFLEDNNSDYLNLRASLFVKIDNYQAAAQVYEQLATTNPKSFSLCEDAVKNYAKSNKQDAVIRVCDSWIQRFDLNERAVYFKLNALETMGENQEALNLIVALETKYPDRERYGIKKINMLLKYNKLNEAFEKTQNMLAKNSNSPELQYLLLKLAIMNGKLDIANEQAQKWCIAPPENADYLLEILKTAESNKMELWKVDCIQKFNSLHTKYTKWNAWYTSYIAKNAKPNEISTIYENAVKLAPNDINAWLKWLNYLYFTNKSQMKTESSSFYELYPLMSLAALYEYASGNTKMVETIINDENTMACKWHILLENNKLSKTDFLQMEKECAGSNNAIIVYWLYKAAIKLNYTEKSNAYKIKAIENGAIIE